MRGEEASEAEVRRFLSQVDKLPNGCWFWAGARTRGKGNKKWYGAFRIKRGGKWITVKAHGYSCEVIGRRPPLPPDHDRDHLCEFTLCVRPEHTEYVTKKINHERRWSRRKSEAEQEGHFDG